MNVQNLINKYKWLIPSERVALKPDSGAESGWDNKHKEGYSQQVFSVTDDENLCKTLIHDIPQFRGAKVLIPGCGSNVKFQEHLLTYCPEIGEVYCTDFSKEAIDIAQLEWHSYSEKIKFEVLDSTKITELKPGWNNYFDFILVVNSVLDRDDVTNRSMIQEFGNALKPGGRIYGFFPTIFCGLEIEQLDPTWSHRGFAYLPSSGFHERRQNYRQIFYTPLRLNRIFKEAGLKRKQFEVFFCDSEFLSKNAEKIYNIDDPDIYIWEFIVRYEK